MTLAQTLLRATVLVLLFAMLTGMVTAWAWAIPKLRRGEPILPEPRPRTVPWGFGSILLVLLLWFLVNLGVMTFYAAINRRPAAAAVAGAKAQSKPDPASLSFTEQMLLLSMANGLLLVAIPPLLRLTARARLADFGLQRQGLVRNAMIGAVGFLLIAPLVYATNFLAVMIWQPRTHPVEKMVRSEPSQGIAQLAILSAVLLAPAAEELIFRAIVQSWLIKVFERSESRNLADDDHPAPTEVSLHPPSAEEVHPYEPPQTHDLVEPDNPSSLRPTRAPLHAIMLTSTLFAAVHLPQWPAPLAIFLLSMGLGVVYQATGSLISSIVMHALFNSLGTLVLLGGMSEGDLSARKENAPASCVGFPTPGAADFRR